MVSTRWGKRDLGNLYQYLYHIQPIYPAGLQRFFTQANKEHYQGGREFVHPETTRPGVSCEKGGAKDTRSYPGRSSFPVFTGHDHWLDMALTA
ncbi:MAG: hypothetical protein CSA34_03250 [Desulfobulbus propionicus]|nr:MAG: hypothetical protein CSA34_03250 [Desulfobulbus propionicus]